MCLAASQPGQYLKLADLEKNILYKKTLLSLGKECPEAKKPKTVIGSC